MSGRTDWSYRNKTVTAKITVGSFPIDESEFPKYGQLLDYVRKKQDLTVVIEIEDSDEFQEIRLSRAGDAYRLAITYPMDDFGWEHPLILANDALTAGEAEEVLRSILVDGTDQTEIITNSFHEVSSTIYEE